MTPPLFRIDIAFDSCPTDSSYTWTALTCWREIGIRRGRQHHLDRFEAGRCRVILDNRSGIFTSTNTAGPYYGNVKPMKPVRVVATYLGTDYTLFQGFIRKWAYSHQGLTEAAATLDCVDGFEAFRNLELEAPTLAQEASGTRIGNLLDEANWPSSLRDLDAGQVNVIADSPGENVLSYISKAVNSEAGDFFVSADGKATFRDRYHRQSNSDPEISAGWGQEFGYQAIQFEDGIDLVRNAIRVSRSGGDDQTASDAQSQLDYFRRDVTIQTLCTSDSAAASVANWLLAKHRESYFGFLRFGLTTITTQQKQSMFY